MNRTAAVLLILAVITFLGGVALFSPRVAVIVGSLLLLGVGVGQLDVGDRK